MPAPSGKEQPRGRRPGWRFAGGVVTGVVVSALVAGAAVLIDDDSDDSSPAATATAAPAPEPSDSESSGQSTLTVVPSGSSVRVGSTLTFEYQVKNEGPVELSGVSIIDDNGTTSDLTDDPALTLVRGDTDGDNRLDVDEEWFYQRQHTVVRDNYASVARASGSGPGNRSADDQDSFSYFGADLNIQVEKLPGDIPPLDVDTPIAFTYRVTNGGNVPLAVSLIDDNGTPVDPTATSTAPAGTTWSRWKARISAPVIAVKDAWPPPARRP